MEDADDFKVLRDSVCRMTAMSLFFAVCATAAFAATAQVETRQERDIPYAEPERCRLDVKWPAGQTNFPTVVWFHAGGLVKGKLPPVLKAREL